MISSFIIDKKNGEERIVQFLPYVGNYGYIPSTFSDPEEGGDGDALDVTDLLSGYTFGVDDLTQFVQIVDKVNGRSR